MITAKLSTQAVAGAAAAVATLEVVSPWIQVFDAQALIVATFGALGGSTRWLFLRESFWNGVRLLLLGAIVAFGVGGLWRVILKQYFSDMSDSLVAQPGITYNGAYLVGLFSVVILGKWLDENEQTKNDRNKASKGNGK